MTNYSFKEWLSFEEAAAWLSDATQRNQDSQTIMRLVFNSRLPAHFWATDDAQIVLFRIRHEQEPLSVPIEAPIRLLVEECEPIGMIDGPVPIRNYRIFYQSMLRVPSDSYVGLPALLAEPEPYGCYRLGDNDLPQSITDGEFETLIHLSDLERLISGPSMPEVRAPHDLVMGVGSLDGIEETLRLGRSTVDWNDYPDSDLPIFPDAEPPELKSEPLLRALGFATHVIADLASELDKHEPTPSQRRRYGIGEGNSPNVTKIGDALAQAAARLRYEGHNYKGAGFKKLLQKALKEIE